MADTITAELCQHYELTEYANVGTTHLSVNKVNWDKVGRVTEPGRYMLRFGYVVITAEDLAIWTQFPDAEFALIEQPSEEPNGEFRLGAFDVTPAIGRDG
jgi:hypothetical protein